MYLKSLSLKGFKSFADKTQLNFDEGISAVVGPNGSGKSNISDALLWVLGERNAKNLRGQAMEDVIFAGTSTRKATSVAEVTLVLDNRDGKLAVDFDEVALTRRMYRSGETEYLINNTLARRMDILDILHDSGLGSQAHSIISQGALDSVLRSKPEDRRLLIEDAAGTLKHKQRKLKSERKIELMDQHLVRVRDIVREIERQLKPLERKASKAQRYLELTAELKDLELRLSVHELGQIKGQWEAAEAQELALEQKSQATTAKLSSIQEALEALQKRIHEEAQEAGSLEEQLRSTSRFAERFDAHVSLLYEKRRSCSRYISDLQVAQDEASTKHKEAQVDFEQARADCQSLAAKLEQIDEELAQAKERKQALVGEINQLSFEVNKRRSEAASLRREQEVSARRLSMLQESLSTNTTEARIAKAHLEKNQEELDIALQRRTNLEQSKQEAQENLDALVDEEAKLKQVILNVRQALEEARSELQAAQAKTQELAAQIAALEELERTSQRANPAQAWLADTHPNLKALSNCMEVPADLAFLVEELLSQLLYTRILESPDEMFALIQDLDGKLSSGSAYLHSVNTSDIKGREADDSEEMLSIEPVQSMGDFRPSSSSSWLLEHIKAKKRVHSLLKDLLGDVLLCQDKAEVFKLWTELGATPYKLRFVCTEGLILESSGLCACHLGKGEDQGTLARIAHIKVLKSDLVLAQKSVEACQGKVQKFEGKQADAQSEHLSLRSAIAELQGNKAAQAEQFNQACVHCKQLEEEQMRLSQALSRAEEAVGNLRPDMEKLEEEQVRRTQELEDLQEHIKDLQSKLDPLQGQKQALIERINDLSVSQARQAEAAHFSERVARSKELEIGIQASRIEKCSNQLQRIQGAVDQILPLVATFEVLATWAAHLTSKLELTCAKNKDEAAVQLDKLGDLRTQSLDLQAQLDAHTQELSQLRVKKGRLEVMVEAALVRIQEEYELSVDRAIEEFSELDLELASGRAADLRDQIGRMGNVNLDAAQEYAELKERFDYMDAQLRDMNEARHALAKIVQAIDERMKRDFENTFAQVNGNFQEIFGVLFPGGVGHLSFVEADTEDAVGIEVHAQPQGKKITKMSLMSGGEKSLVALALLFAVYRIRQAPFYVLDEVEAALDDTNLTRLVAYLDSLRDETQLIMITHQRRTMEMADALFGVSMHSDGITRVISQKLS